MAYNQSPGRSPLEKTGRGMGPILQKIAGTDAQQKANPNFFSQKLEESKKYSQAPDFMGNMRKEKAAEKELRANAAFSGNSEKIAQYDAMVKNNSLGIKSNFGEAVSYGKGSAKPSDTSAETMILKQNQGQLPGEKGFKGGTDRSGLAIFPNIKGSKTTGEIPAENQGSGPNYAGNTSKTYYKSNTPGNLGKLETLSTGRIGSGGQSGTGDTSRSVIGRSFGAIDQFNQEKGGTMNSSKIGRDRTFGTSIGEDTRANTFKFATGPSGNQERQEAIDRSVAIDLAKGQGTLARQPIYKNEQGQQAVRRGDTNTLLSMTKSAGPRGETALGYLEAAVEGNKPGPKNAGYESSYKQKYDYPTDETLDFKQGSKGTTYSGPKGGGYFSPESTFAQNRAAASAADSNMGLKDFLTKGKSYFNR